MVEMRPMPGVSAELGAGIRRQWIEQARPGALLVTGATQSARQEAADWLIQAILCEGKPSLRPCGNCWSCRQFNLGQHPDLHAIQSDLEHVGIDEIRELGDALALTAHRATRKIGWIPKADRLTEGAANAFLKTLEEPPGPTVFILETSRPGSLKVTIQSRCLRLRIQHGHATPGLAPTRPDDPDFQARSALIGDYARLLDGEIGPLDLDRHRSTISLAERAHDWSLWLAAAALSRLGWPVRNDVPEPLGSRLARLPLERLLPLYTRARETERIARTTANDRLAYEALLVSILKGGGHDGCAN